MKPAHSLQTVFLGLAVGSVSGHALPPMVTEKAVLKKASTPTERRSYICTDWVTEVSDFLSTMLSPEVNFDYVGFCSDYLQSTQWHYISSGTVTRPYSQHPSVTVWPTTTTTVYGSTSTTTALCPTPLPNMKCNIITYSYPVRWPLPAKFDLLQGKSEFTDIWTCGQLCLANQDCKSWYVEDWQPYEYNLRQHNEPESLKCVGMNATIPPQNDVVWRNGWLAPVTVFDRNCQDFLPDACSTPTPSTVFISIATPTITQAPAMASASPTLVRKDIESWTIPSYLTEVYPAIPSWACSCAITAPSPVRTITATVPASGVFYYITSTYTRHHTKTVHANWTTTTSSVV